MQLGGEGCAVFPHGEHFVMLRDGQGGVGQHRVAEGRDDQVQRRPPDQVGLVIAEHPRQAQVGLHDPPLVVDRHPFQGQVR